MAMRTPKTEDKQTELATQRTRLRDDDQKALDTDVAGQVKEWDDAGHPDDGNPTRRYDVDDIADAKRRVRRAFTLINKGRKDAKPAVTPVSVAPMWWKDGPKDADGFVSIKWGVRESIPADDKASADAEKDAEKADGETTPETPETPNAETPETPETPDANAGDQAPFDPAADQEGEQASETRGFRRGRR